MLRLSILELIFRTIPEGFVFILASYAISRKQIEKNRYIISSILLGLIIYFIRMLPIHFGVHTILNIMFYILLSAAINKVDVIKAVYAALISSIIMFISEASNIILLDKLFNIKIENFANDVNMKLLYSMPSFIFFAVTIFILYKVLRRTERG